MVKLPREKSESVDLQNKEGIEFKATDDIGRLNYHHNKRLRRTLSFINSNRKRAVKYCTMNRLMRNRRLSLGNNSKHNSHVSNKQAVIHKNECKSQDYLDNVSSSSLKSTKMELKKYAEELSVKSSPSSSTKRSSFMHFRPSLRKTVHQKKAQDLNMESVFKFDQSLKKYMENQINHNGQKLSVTNKVS
jgi:hypothetical protein